MSAGIAVANGRITETQTLRYRGIALPLGIALVGRLTERYTVERLITRWGRGWRVRDNERGEYVSEILPTQERAERCKAALIRDDARRNAGLLENK